MQKGFIRFGATAALMALVSATAVAKPPMHHTAKATPPKCPVCGMFLASKKTAKESRMVKIHGKTYYCCTKCDMSKMSHHPMKGHSSKK